MKLFNHTKFANYVIMETVSKMSYQFFLGLSVISALEATKRANLRLLCAQASELEFLSVWTL